MKPPVTAAREALAEAVASYAALQAHIIAVAKAEEAATAAWRAARDAAAAAAEGSARARREAVAHLVALAKGAAGAPPLSIQDAAAAVIAAEECVAAALAARDELSEQLRQEQDRIPLRKLAVEDAARAVLGGEAACVAAELLVELEELHWAVLDKGHLLRWLHNQGVLVPPREAAASMLEVSNRLDMRPTAWDIPGGLPSGLGQPMQPPSPRQAAFVALKVDPNAPLPSDAATRAL